MIPIKTSEGIAIMKEGGKKLGLIRDHLRDMVAVGVTPQEIDTRADKLIKEAGGEASFKKVKGYRWATCINTNSGVVHGIPTQKPFKDGDLVSVDVGLFYKGFHTDTSFTVPAGKIESQVQRFLETGKKALKKAILEARTGNRVSHISRAIQEAVEAQGYSPVRALIGHGIGRKLHEEPQIPCFWPRDLGTGELIPEGAVFAIEAIYAEGAPDLMLLEDNWTIATKDGKIAGLFEETVAVTDKGPLVLTA